MFVAFQTSERDFSQKFLDTISCFPCNRSMQYQFHDFNLYSHTFSFNFESWNLILCQVVSSLVSWP